MIILDLSNSGLAKALASNAPSASAAVSVPGGGEGGGRRGGPGGQPQPGHKYVSRTWNKDHWEYDYAKDPHAQQHGLGYVSHDHHTIDLPAHVDSGQLTAEDAYGQSTRHWTSTPGSKFDAIDPVSGEPIELHVVASGRKNDHPLGVKIVAVSKTEKREKGPRKGDPAEIKGKPEGMAKYPGYGWSSFAGFEVWSRKANSKDFEEIPGPDGNVHYVISPNVGLPDVQQGMLIAPKGLRFRIAFSKNSPEYGGGDANNADWAATFDDAKAMAEMRVAKNAAIAATESGEIPSLSDRLAGGQNPREILQEGNLPKERNPNNRRGYQTKFDSPEQKEAFINYLAGSVYKQTHYMADKLTRHDFLARNKPQIIQQLTGAGVAGGREMGEGFALSDAEVAWLKENPQSFKLDKTSPLHRFMASAVNNYNPEVGNFESYVFGSIPKRFFEWIKVGGFAGTEQQERQLEGTSDNLASENRTKDQGALTGEDAEKFEAQRGQETWDAGSEVRNWKNDQMVALDRWHDRAEEEGDREFGEYIGKLKDHLDSVLESQGGIETGIPAYAAGLKNLADHLYANKPEQREDFYNQVIMDIGKAIKSLTAILIKSMAANSIAMDLREQIAKATSPAPSPDHQYSHKEGMEDHPTYWWNDQAGNQVRYTNAPDGHPDSSPTGGSPQMHASEVTADASPEYFTPDGRKMTRAPHSTAQIQWNPNYHKNDPQNLWAARWVNPATGDHEYSYIEADLFGHEKLVRHHQNRIIDVRLPHMRQYINSLLHSDQEKDNVVGLMMALVDQGRIHPVELVELRAGDVQMNGDIVRFGRFAVHAGEKIHQIIHRMMMKRQPENEFFSVPVVRNDPNSVIGVDTEFRVIGPHYIVRMFDRLGTPFASLMNYHATQTYSMQVQRCIQGEDVSLQCGHEFALLEVARRMGHNFTNQPDINPIIKYIEETMIDPIVVEVIKQNAVNNGQDQGRDQVASDVVLAVPHVSANLNSHTSGEKEFSKWMHLYEFHHHAELEVPYSHAV